MKEFLIKIFGLLVVIFITLFISYNLANATTFVNVSDELLTQESIAVIMAKVQRIRSIEVDGAIKTFIDLKVLETLAGRSYDKITLEENGGRFKNRGDFTIGSAQYIKGQVAIIYVGVRQSKSFYTLGMGLGQYQVIGNNLYQESEDIVQLKPNKRAKTIQELKDKIRGIKTKESDFDNSLTLVSGEVEEQESFTYLGTSAKWFFNPIYKIDQTGDLKVGPTLSNSGAIKALNAWSSNGSLYLAYGGTTVPTTYAGCNEPNRIIFNDPFNEITDLNNCSGTLAIGGFCTSGEESGFRKIVRGKIMFNNGFANCNWNECNLSEVATHELGHTIGFGHSTDATATMAAIAHFDGRCATLKSDDLLALLTSYPVNYIIKPFAGNGE